MASQRLTNAEIKLLREQSSLSHAGVDARWLLILLACATLGWLVLAIWGAKLAVSGIALLPGM